MSDSLLMSGFLVVTKRPLLADSHVMTPFMLYLCLMMACVLQDYSITTGDTQAKSCHCGV